MEEYDLEELRKTAEFTQFRLNLIHFLRLPLNVSESALLGVLMKCSRGLHANYLSRAARGVGKIQGPPPSLTEPMRPGGATPGRRRASSNTHEFNSSRDAWRIEKETTKGRPA